MAVIHDMMPAFELFQPASLDDALGLLDRHGADASIERTADGWRIDPKGRISADGRG